MNEPTPSREDIRQQAEVVRESQHHVDAALANFDDCLAASRAIIQRDITASGRAAEAELYVVLRKAGEDRHEAQALIDRLLVEAWTRGAGTVEAMNEGCSRARPCASCDAREDAAGALRDIARRRVARHAVERAATMHAVPLPGSNGISACCGRPPCEFVGERVTRDPDKVTCPGPAEAPQAGDDTTGATP